VSTFLLPNHVVTWLLKIIIEKNIFNKVVKVKTKISDVSTLEKENNFNQVFCTS
jgi:hypothetical protein